VSDAPPSVPWPDVLASIPDGLLVVNAEGVVAALNPAAEALLEASRDLLLGRTLSEVLAAPAFAWLVDLASRTLGDGRSRHRVDAPWQIRQGTRTIEATVAPVHDTRGRLWGAAIVLHDHSTSRALSPTASTADRVNRLATTVLGLAHEIRNPLSSIKGAAELLRSPLDPTRRDRCVAVIASEVDRMNRLVTDLATLGDPPRLRQDPVNLNRVLSDVLALEAEGSAWGRIHVRTDFDPSLPPVRGDVDRLTQLFLNLVRNAVEALGGTGTLQVSSQLETGLRVRRDGGTSRLVSVRIIDDGPGIAPEAAADIFTPFYSTKSRGSGLGLAICQQIATGHGGGLAYEPRPGGGSIFLVRLPLMDQVHVDS